MNYVNDIFLGVMFILFPIFSYMLYVAYNKNIDKEEDELIFCFALFSSIYLVLSKMNLYYPRIGLYMADIIILIAYLRNRPKTACVLSLISIFFFFDFSNIFIVFLLLEYTFYFILNFVRKKYNLHVGLYSFVCITLQFVVFVLMQDNHYYDNTIITYLLAILCTCLVVFLVDRIDSIFNYNLTYKELVQEKQVRSYLFKITHEIKNPLAVCKGYFQMLDLENAEQCKKYIPIIKSEVNHALLILNDFSNLSKIKVTKDIMDVSLLVKETITNLREYLRQEGVKIIYKKYPEIYMDGDYNRLMQVLINIIKNSSEALADKKTKQIKISLIEEEKHVILIVKDNGCGMDEYTLKEFDTPFFTTKKDGTGLGTVLSKEIIIAHNGTIEYESKVDKGTTVTIKLPKKSY